jgi:hypothetical protein
VFCFVFTPSGFGEHEVVNPLAPLPFLERERGREKMKKKRKEESITEAETERKKEKG